MQNQRTIGVHLVIAQQNLLFFAINDEVDDGRMEGFLLQLEQQVVVDNFDILRGRFATVNNTRDGASATQAAGVINFSQGEFVMLPAFAVTGRDPWAQWRK